MGQMNTECCSNAAKPKRQIKPKYKFGRACNRATSTGEESQHCSRIPSDDHHQDQHLLHN